MLMLMFMPAGNFIDDYYLKFPKSEPQKVSESLHYRIEVSLFLVVSHFNISMVMPFVVLAVWQINAQTYNDLC